MAVWSGKGERNGERKWQFGQPKVRGVEKGSGRRATFRSKKRSVFNQTNKVAFMGVLKDGAERVWLLTNALSLS